MKVKLLYNSTGMDIWFTLLPSEKAKLWKLIDIEPPRMILINYNFIEFNVEEWIIEFKERITNMFSYGKISPDMFEIEPN